MGVLADCLEWFDMVGPGMFLYQQAGSDLRVPHNRVYELARQQTRGSDDVALLIPVSALTSPTLRARLDAWVAGGSRLVVVPFQQGGSGVLDLDRAARVQDRLGIVIGVPGSAVEGGVPPDLAARLVPIEPTQVNGPTGRSATAYRLLPEALVANRRQLAELATAAQPPSVAKLVSHFGIVVPAGGDSWPYAPENGGADSLVAGDLSPLAGVYYATFGNLPNLTLAKLLASTTPLSRPHLNEALGLDEAHGLKPVPMSRADLLQEFESGRAAAALVHASSRSPTPGSFWLVRNDAGELLWATGTQPAGPVVLDGGLDWRAAVLDRPDSEFVVVGSSGVPYLPELATRTPPVRVSSAGVGEPILLGPGGPSVLRDEIKVELKKLPGHDGQILLVDVRRGARAEHGTTLDESIARSLRYTLAKNPAISLVVATEHNDELEFLVVDQYRRSLVQPRMRGLGRFWEAQTPQSDRDLYLDGSLTSAFARALALANPPKSGPSGVVGGLIFQRTWTDVEAYLNRHSGELLNWQVVQQLADVEAESVANGERISRYGTGRINEHPFYRPDRTTPVLRVMIEQDLRAQEDGGLRGVDWRQAEGFDVFTREVEPQSGTADSGPFRGYLTMRRGDPDRLNKVVYDNGLALLWLGVNVHLATGDADRAAANLANLLTVIRGRVGMWEDQAIDPKQLAISEAQAEIVGALADIVGGKGAAADWPGRLQAIDCLTGGERAFWHFAMRHIIVPRFKAHEAEFRRLLDRIITCYDKVGA